MPQGIIIPSNLLLKLICMRPHALSARFYYKSASFHTMNLHCLEQYSRPPTPTPPPTPPPPPKIKKRKKTFTKPSFPLN